MNPKEIHNRFQEFKNLQTQLGYPPPNTIEIAFFIEDNFDIVLNNQEISPEYIGDLSLAETFILNKLKGNQPCAESAES